MNCVNFEPVDVFGKGLKMLIGIFFLILSVSTNTFADDCFFNSNFKIKIPVSKDEHPFGALLKKMKTPEKQIENIASEYFSDNGQMSSLDDSVAGYFDIADSNDGPMFRIISVQVGSDWDCLYVVFKKASNGWTFLKYLPISRIDDSTAMNVFNFRHHLFLVLEDVQDHGMGTSGSFATANYDFYLMDQGMREAGHAIAYGNPDGAIMGALTYQTSGFKLFNEGDCLLEQDLKIDCDAFFGSSATNWKKKYEFDDFKAFSRSFRLIYRWNDYLKKFIFYPDQSDFKINPIGILSSGLDENNFLRFFYPELERVAQEKNKNKNIWIMSTLDYIKGSDPEIIGYKNNLLQLMK